MKDRQIHKNISLSMFGYIEPEPDLAAFFQNLIIKTGCELVITNAGLSVVEYINLYKKLEKEGKLNGKKWHEAIHWKSRHLAKFGCKLRAADFFLVKGDETFMKGDEIRGLAKEYSDNNNIPFGFGAGKLWAHIDVDRKQWTEWAYNR